MKLFITGIAGFVGSSIAEHFFSMGYGINGIDNLFTGDRNNLSSVIKWKFADISEESSFKDIDTDYDIVIHLAAQTSGEKSFEMPDYDINTNIKGTYNVYQFAKRCKAKLMINMSSMSVYGDVPDMQIVAEDYIPKPVSIYGNSKLAAERMLQILSREDNIPVVSLRLFNAYGPKQNMNELKQGMISIYLAQFLYHNEVVVKGSYSRVRDFIYIDDIIDAIDAISNSTDVRSDIYNLSSGVLNSVGDVIENIKLISGIKKNIINKGNTKGDIMGFGGNIKKISNQLNWKPKISLKEGLKKMIMYYTKGNSYGK